jgi:hypothetical protein
MSMLSLPDDLTPEEAKAIRALDRLAHRWPDTLMIASMGGLLYVLRLDEDGGQPMSGGEGVHRRLDDGAIVYSVPAELISNTGGDW